MKVADLRPATTGSEPFSRDRARYVPPRPGCYVLTTVSNDILYIGLASRLAGRFVQHLDNADKVRPTEAGRAVVFQWLETEALEATERAWLNAFRTVEARLPILNKVDSPIAY